MSQVELPPLPSSTAAWVDDPGHPRSSPGDPLRRWTGEFTADDVQRHGEACARAALEAAADLCIDRKIEPIRGVMEYDAGYNDGCLECANAIRALSVGSGGSGK